MSRVVRANETVEVTPNPNQYEVDSNTSKNNIRDTVRVNSREDLDEEEKRQTDFQKLNDEMTGKTVEKIDENEEELEALMYEGIAVEDENEHLIEEINHDREERVKEVDEKVAQQYSQSFVRQLTDLKELKHKKEKYKTQQTIVRDASNGLSYTRMKQRIERTHPRKFVNGRLVKYPI